MGGNYNPLHHVMAKHDPNRLTPEKDGRFCKRVRGVLYHFGRDHDHDLALREWLKAKPLLLAGKRLERAAERPVLMTVNYVKEHFLKNCGDRVKDKTLRGGTFDDYDRAADEFAAHVGGGRDPDDLAPDDFASIRAAWAARMGPWSLDRHVQAVRTMFNHALTYRLIARAPFYGNSFHKSSEADKRAAGREREKTGGARIFSDEELIKILAAAAGNLRAMILLGLNAGMYAADISLLTWSSIRREGGQRIIDFDRRKTGGVHWKFPLWPETVAALAQVRRIQRRRKKFREPRVAAHADLIFRTLHGRPYHRENTLVAESGRVSKSIAIDTIGQEFRKLLERLKIKRAGVSFGALRHTHITAVGDHVDERAARRVRGHKVKGIEKHYDKIPIERLKQVTDLARQRLLRSAPRVSRRKPARKAS